MICDRLLESSSSQVSQESLHPQTSRSVTLEARTRLMGPKQSREHLPSLKFFWPAEFCIFPEDCCKVTVCISWGVDGDKPSKSKHGKASNHDSSAPAVPLTGQHLHLPFIPVGSRAAPSGTGFGMESGFSCMALSLPFLGQHLNSQSHCSFPAKTKSGTCHSQL